MKEIILCKYGEIVLKGLNRGTFEAMLVKELQKRLKGCGNFKVYHEQSTAYIEPLDDDADLDLAMERAGTVFGFVSLSRACVVEKNVDAIAAAAKEYLPQFLHGAKSFKAEAKRSDKRFPVKSPELQQLVGGAVLEVMPRLKVDVHHPQVVVRVEIREYGAYLHAGVVRGAGGIPTGSAGKALLLLSGGIDSPVAGYRMARRGIALDALHFESYPYTSVQAREKVIELAQIMTDYCGDINLNIISVTHIQEELRDKCREEYFTLLLRRFMMKIAERIGLYYNCTCIITGESVGQVASQTIPAITVTNDAVKTLPVIRPLIANDKEEIVKYARHIGTFETSILPYEDCCTVFTPKHPRTRPTLRLIEEAESAFDFSEMIDRAVENVKYECVD